jgi:hypothetical protein
MAYEMVAKLKARDLVAVKKAREDASISIIDMVPEERAKFRNIAKDEWKVWAEKSALNQNSLLTNCAIAGWWRVPRWQAACFDQTTFLQLQ